MVTEPVPEEFAAQFAVDVPRYYNSTERLKELQDLISNNLALMLTHELSNGSQMRHFVNVHDISLVNIQDSSNDDSDTTSMAQLYVDRQ